MVVKGIDVLKYTVINVCKDSRFVQSISIVNIIIYQQI